MVVFVLERESGPLACPFSRSRAERRKKTVTVSEETRHSRHKKKKEEENKIKNEKKKKQKIFYIIIEERKSGICAGNIAPFFAPDFPGFFSFVFLVCCVRFFFKFIHLVHFLPLP